MWGLLHKPIRCRYWYEVTDEQNTAKVHEMATVLMMFRIDQETGRLIYMTASGHEILASRCFDFHI